MDPSQKLDENHTFRKSATDRQRFQVHLDFGRVFEAQGQFDRAVQEYQDALTVAETKRCGEFQPADRALAHRRIAAASDRLGRFDQAEDHYKKALKLSPKDSRLWNDAGYSYYLQRRWDEARQALETARKLAPDDPRIRTNLGLTFAATGRTQEALPLLGQSQGDAVGHTNLGYLLAADGHHAEAREHYQEALALRPDLDLARRALVQLDRQQGARSEPAAPPRSTGGTAPIPGPLDTRVTPASVEASRPDAIILPPPPPPPLPLPSPPMPSRTLPLP